MNSITRAAQYLTAQRGLVTLLLLLTVLTGLVDAVSYLRLGHVFVANMTGNVVFLGFAAADPLDFSVPLSAAATASFLLGALAGGHMGRRWGGAPAALVAVMVWVQLALFAAALWGALRIPAADLARWPYPLAVPLAIAMGLQTAVARRIAQPDLSTSVLTLTLTGVAADAAWAGGDGRNLRRRLAAVAAMGAGAAIGAALVVRWGLSPALAAAMVVLAAIGWASRRLHAG